MKICYLANAQSIHTQRWATHFASRGYQVTIVSFQSGEIAGVKVFQPPLRSSQRHLNILLNLATVRRMVREIGPDILHAHYATSYGLAGALTGRHPLVVTAWGSDVLITPEESWVYRQIVRFALGHAELVTTSAHHVTKHIIERGYATAEKTVTLLFGVDTDVFNVNQRTRQHGNVAPVIVSTRRLDQGLDVHLFIHAIPQVLDRYTDAHFIVTGDGPLRSSIKQLASELGVEQRVEFKGMIPHRDMPHLLGQADIFVSTSRSDANNVSLNEAMACGAFPIATDIAANRAWIQHGKNGLLFSPQNADQLARKIIKAIGHPEWRQAVMPQNWEIVRTKASWSKSMHEMDHHYARLLHKKLA